MINLTDYLDRLSIIKVLSFFLLVMLVFTLIPMLFDFHLGNLTFKFILYGVMLLFFLYKFNSISADFTKDCDSSISESPFLSDAFLNDLYSIFKVSKIYHILFIVFANILFVSSIYFILSYLSLMSFIQFDAPLFGDFTLLDGDVIFLYLIAVVILSPIIEEFLFRGIFLRRFNLELDNLTLAILISSLLFGICHNFGGILGAILFGICVSILYVKSRNILVPILAHFLNNLISFLLALIGFENFIHGNYLIIAIIIILAILSNFVLFRAIFKEWPKAFK